MSEKQNGFKCVDCLKSFSHSSGLCRHRKRVHSKLSPLSYLCPECLRSYTRLSDLRRHFSTSAHSGEPLKKRIRTRRTSESPESSSSEEEEVKIAGKGTVGSWRRKQAVQDVGSDNSSVSNDSTDYEQESSTDLTSSTSEVTLGDFFEDKENNSAWQEAESPTPTLSAFETTADPPDTITWPVEDYYEVFAVHKSYSKRLKTTVDDYELRLTKDLAVEGFADTYRKLHGLLDSVVGKLTKQAPQGAHGRFVFRTAGLTRALYQTRYGSLDELNIDQITNKICQALNSNEEAQLDEGLKINFLHTEMPRGSGRQTGSCSSRKEPDLKRWKTKKRSVIDVASNTDDSMCLARTVVAGRFHAERIKNNPFPTAEDVKVWKKLRRPGCRRGFQRDCAVTLCQAAGVDPERDAGLEEAAKFQEVLLPQFQLVIFDVDDSIVFEGDCNNIPDAKPIYIFYENNHYNLITTLPGFLSKDKACEKCHKGYKISGQGLEELHSCTAAICGLCHNVACKNTEIHSLAGHFQVVCPDCSRDFPTSQCLNAHKPEECAKFCRCLKCKKTVKRTKLDDHHCMMIKCSYCKDWKPPFHQCYIQRPKNKRHKIQPTTEAVDEAEDERLSDEECQQEYFAGMDEALRDYLGEGPTIASDDDISDAESLGSEDGSSRLRNKRNKKRHQVEEQNFEPLRVYSDFESEFLKNDQHNATLLMFETHLGGRGEFEGSDCGVQFITHLMSHKKFRKATVIFHGLGNYDGFLILNSLHKMDKRPSKIIYRDGRILSFTLSGCSIRFIDSYLFVPLALAKIPKAFGETDLSKGYFPYRFLRPENRNYCENCMPPFESFDPESKSSADYQKLKLWYSKEEERLKNDPDLKYDLETELRSYCRNDVSVLKTCMEKFRAEMMDSFENLDPFEKITLPSYCNYVYRSLYMPENTIAILPPNGFGGRSNQSSSALAWLDWLSFTSSNKANIRHAGNGHEVKIGNVYLDGYFEDPDGVKYAFEFFGCYYHGHLGCQKSWKINDSAGGRTMLQLYRETVERLDYLESLGFVVIHCWECELKRMAKLNKQLAEFLKLRKKCREPLKPRDALRGGRCNANRLFYQKKPGESLRFMDYTSLYPSVQLCTDGEWWPVGHPTVYTHGFPPIEDIFGLIKGVFLPPKRLYFPILPTFLNGKVLFGLCFTCMSEGSTAFCEHPEKLRAIAGTFVSPEVHEAIRMGYRCLEIFEVWHWKHKTQSELFGDYLRAAYRDKVEASGWPDGVDSEEKKRAHIDHYRDAQGVELRHERIEKNPGRRQCAKATITNLWGFFCKTGNPVVTRYVKDHAEICRLTGNKTLEIKEVYKPFGDQLVFRYRKVEEFETPDEKCNVVIGCFTTCYGRLRLFKCLHKLGKLILYFDTDSVVYIERPGGATLETGTLMGELTDEILQGYGSGVEIDSFCSSGAKSYAMVLKDKVTGDVVDVIQKLKGFRLNVRTQEHLNRFTLNDAVFFNAQQRVPCHQIVKYSKTGEIFSKSLEKTFRCTYNKRLRLKKYKTLPIGTVAEVGDKEKLM